MNKTAPHYLLFTEAKNASPANGVGNRWRFVLEEIGTTNRFEEADEEPGVHGERLQLLAVVRGLEAIEQPSRVTLITPSKHVGRGIRRSLTLWRENDWHWERFGKMTLIKDHDLWQRIDRAREIHEINCRIWQFDPPHVRTQAPQESDQSELLAEPSPFVSPINNVVENELKTSEANSVIEREPIAKVAQETRSPRIMAQTLTLERSQAIIEKTLDKCARVDKALEGKIRPIGQGRAYGYAVN